MKRFAIALAIIGVVCAVTVRLSAHAPSGAIFTTVADGSEVNFNIYPSKEAVYLDGGPGPGAPQEAAGLDDGIYVFQVTDPSGKKLLSTDAAKCRQFTVSAGIITSLAPSDPACAHVTGLDIDHGALTVQLMPYANTPNPGGVYKVWVTFQNDFIAGCAKLTKKSALGSVDCGYNAGNFHGFLPAHSKTDNFKVKNNVPREIDTKFCNDRNNNGVCEPSLGEEWLDGLGVTWLDTLGAQNDKWSYLNTNLNVNHEAHVEGVEDGNHRIMIPSQAGCDVEDIIYGNEWIVGPGTVNVSVANNFSGTIFIFVACAPMP